MKLQSRWPQEQDDYEFIHVSQPNVQYQKGAIAYISASMNLWTFLHKELIKNGSCFIPGFLILNFKGQKVGDVLPIYEPKASYVMFTKSNLWQILLAPLKEKGLKKPTEFHLSDIYDFTRFSDQPEKILSIRTNLVGSSVIVPREQPSKGKDAEVSVFDWLLGPIFLKTHAPLTGEEFDDDDDGFIHYEAVEEVLNEQVDPEEIEEADGLGQEEDPDALDEAEIAAIEGEEDVYMNEEDPGENVAPPAPIIPYSIEEVMAVGDGDYETAYPFNAQASFCHNLAPTGMLSDVLSFNLQFSEKEPSWTDQFGQQGSYWIRSR